MEDDDKKSKGLEEFVDSSEDEREDIYDISTDPTLLKEVNNWMYNNNT